MAARPEAQPHWSFLRLRRMFLVTQQHLTAWARCNALVIAIFCCSKEMKLYSIRLL